MTLRLCSMFRCWPRWPVAARLVSGRHARNRDHPARAQAAGRARNYVWMVTPRWPLLHVFAICMGQAPEFGVCVHSITIAASGSVPNLDFVDFARVTAANPAIPDSATEILSYARSEAAPSGSAIDVSMATPIDITSLWSADKAVIELQVAGQLPEQDWTVDVTLNLSGKMTYQF